TEIKSIILENGNTIRITNPHKLLTSDGWTNNLMIGMNVGTYNPLTNSNNIDFSRIVDIKPIIYNDYVYDLEIDRLHNYVAENIVDKKVSKGTKTKTTYRKTQEGEFERDIAVDRIYNLNNTLIIVDEAHNLTGNAYGKALEKIIQNSINLRVVLMSATLMKNL